MSQPFPACFHPLPRPYIVTAALAICVLGGLAGVLLFPALGFGQSPSAARLPSDSGSRGDARHWSFRPRSMPAVPRFADAENRRWLRTPVDAFILATLKKH